MATLQKIRNRGGIIVSIVIGLALFAFIAGDAFSSGSVIFNRSRNEVGEIAGESISIMDYQKEIAKNEAYYKTMSGVTALSADQQYDVRENTWNDLVNNIVMGNEYNALGMDVSGDELYNMFFGSNINPMISQLFGNAQPEQIRDYIRYLLSLPDQEPQKAYWLYMEKQIANSRKNEKFNQLLAKGLYTTNAEAQKTIDNGALQSNISYLVKNYSSINDSTVNVSNSEIREYYNANEKLFQQPETRKINYINFDINPSADDYTEIRKWIASLMDEFAETENPIEFVDLSSDVKFDPFYYRMDEITNDSLALFLSGRNNKGVYGPYLENDAYKISRIASERMLPDSVRARHILIAPQNNDYMAAKNIADSLADLLRKGANFETIARQHSTDQGSAVNGGDLGWFGPRMMVQPFSDSAFFSKLNEIKVVATQFGVHIVQVTNRANPVRKIQVATVVKEVIPSQTTINKVYNIARDFATGVQTLEDFDKKNQENGFIKRIANVNKNDIKLADMEDTREVVRQVYLAKNVNEVILNNEGANIFDMGDRFIIAVLTEINEKGVSPVANVATAIKQELIRRKKAEIISKEFSAAISGSQSLLSVGQKLNLTVKDASDISFNSFQIPGAGVEPQVIATATLQEEGVISTPIAGNIGVYLIVVNSKNTSGNETDLEGVKMGLQQSNTYRASYQAQQVLMEHADIHDLRYKFY